MKKASRASEPETPNPRPSVPDLPISRPTASGSWLRTGLAILGLLASLVTPAAAQMPQMPGMPPGMQPPNLDPAEMQRRLQEELVKCLTGNAGTGPYDVAMCKTLQGMTAISTGQQESGLAQMREAIAELEKEGDYLARIMVYLMMSEATRQLGRDELAKSSLEEAIEALEALRVAETPISKGSLGFFGRLSGMPDSFLTQLESMMTLVRPMFVDQFELQFRLRLAQILLQGNPDEAEPHFEKALELSKRLFGLMDTQILDYLGQLREKQGRAQEAKDYYRRAADAARIRGDLAYQERLERRLESLAPVREEASEESEDEDGGGPSPPRQPSEDTAGSGSPSAAGLSSMGMGAAGFDVDEVASRFDAASACGDPDTPDCLALRGIEAHDEGRPTEAIEYFEAALPAYESSGDRVALLLIRTILANAYSMVQQNDRSLELLGRASADLDSLLDPEQDLGEGTLIDWFRRLGGFPGSPNRPMTSRERRIMHTLIEMVIRERKGKILVNENRLADAEEEVRKAALLAESFYGLMDAQVFDTYAQIVALRGRYGEAAELYARAFESTRALNELSTRFDISRRWAEMESIRGNTREARRLGQLALDLARRMEDPARKAFALTDLTLDAFDRGERNEANRWAREALTAADQSDDTMAQIRAHLGNSLLAVASSNYETALASADRILELSQNLNADRPGLARLKTVILTATGGIYFQVGRPDRFAAQVAKAREVAEANGDAVASAWVEAMEDVDRHLEGRPNALGTSIESLLSQMRRSDMLHLRTLPEVSPGLSLVPAVARLDAESVSAAETWLEEHGEDAPVMSVAAGLVKAMGLAAEGRASEALELIENFGDKSRDRGFSDLGALLLGLESHIHLMNGQTKEAMEHARRAIVAFEEIGGSLRIDELLSSLSGRHQSFYRMAVLLFATEGEAEEAFLIAEKARARALLHSLGNQRFHPRKGADRDLLRKLDEQRSAILRLEKTEASQEALRQLRGDYRETLIRVKLRHPETHSLVAVEPLELDTLQNEILPPETNLISFFVAPTRVVAWVIDRDTFEQIQLPTPEPEVYRCFTNLIRREQRGAELVGAVCDGSDLEGLLERYFRELVTPLLPRARHDRWILVPHDLLHYLPFSALRDPGTGRLLLELKTLSYAPSVSSMRFLTEKDGIFGGRALVLGNPETELEALAGAEGEAHVIAELFGAELSGAELLIGEEATEHEIYENRAIDVLHLAAHGVFRPRAPRFSYLALAPGGDHDGRLEVDEVFSTLDLEGVDLVTLSACQTALGEHTSGDEIVGLARAFLYAGSPAVVSTLWRVDDEATEYLMITFYRQLLGGATYAEALRTAQLCTSEREGWDDPYYWAAFTLTGDPGVRWVQPDLQNTDEPWQGGGSESSGIGWNRDSDEPACRSSVGADVG